MKLSTVFFIWCMFIFSTKDGKNSVNVVGEIDSCLLFPTSSLNESEEFKPEKNIEQEIKLGLLTSKKITVDGNSLAAKRGAGLAILQANERGGYRGHPFGLISRSCKGPWGSGIKAATDLVFQDKVWAILGSLDGRNAHLAEQVITKSNIVLLCTRATDPTLSRINIPWFFRCIPDDEQQAQVLVREIFKIRKTRLIAIVAAEGYDGQMAASSFSKVVRKEGYTIHTSFSFDASNQDFQDLSHKLSKSEVESIVLFGPSSSVKKIISQMRKDGMKHTIFGSFSDARLTDLNIEENGRTVFFSSNFRETLPGRQFVEKFQKTYGYSPNATAAYAYDGMNLLIEAIKKAGLNREKIKDVLAKTDYSNGVTGPIRFDENGNRIGHANLIKTGKPDSER